MDDGRIAALLRTELAQQVASLESDEQVRSAGARFDAAVADLLGGAVRPRRPRTVRSAWLLPVAAAGVAILVFGGLAALSARRSAPPPTSATSPSASAPSSTSAAITVTGLLGTWIPTPGQTVTGFGHTQGLGGTLDFVKGGSVGGTDSCNSYGGTYVADDHGALTFSTMGETLVGCTGDRNDGGLPVLLAQVKGWAVRSGQLTLTTRAGKRFLLDRVPARDVFTGTWRLTDGQRVGGPTYADTKPLVGALTLVSPTKYSIQVGCNVATGTYTADDTGAVVLGRPTTTDVHCPLPSNSVSLADVIDEMTGWTEEYSRLVLTGGSVVALTFQR
jgi:heat shock protein HslJ